MKYRDLIAFEPITGVVQIAQAGEMDKARELVSTYVASDRMIEQIRIMVDHLQFDKQIDNHGLLVVGNYGTGKSHLMSVIGAVAENSNLLSAVRNPALGEVLQPIAGRFLVLRMEVPAVTTDLYTIITTKLSDALAHHGIDFEFPPLNQATANKERLMEMMGRFQEKYPDQGFLLVLDELLDYLRGRKEQELTLDLGFLRELGEVTANTRFRVIAGVQEMLFGNPRFQFAADSLRRVQARFEQIHIVRDDVAYVVSERLLKKTEEQKAWIRQYLQRFAPLYPQLSQRLEVFVELFPVHPRFFDVFSQVWLGEKREILRTLTAEIQDLMGVEVDETVPHLITYDRYWRRMMEDSSFKTNPDFDKLSRRTQTIMDRLGGMSRPAYRPVAERVVAALAVMRLAVDSMTAPLGPTVADLTDDLMLFLPLPEMTQEFLEQSVRTVIQEIRRVLGGQFIRENPDNHQFYIELDGGVDYDELIRQKADTLDADRKNAYYFEVLKQVLECSASTYGNHMNTWEHQVVWPDRHAERPGYLFFGPPNKRSTTQPPRDFYIYFLEIYERTRFPKEDKPDEVFFKLERADEVFGDILLTYAAAKELAQSSAAADKKQYEARAEEKLKELAKWVREHFATHYDVEYQGKSERVSRVLKRAGISEDHASVVELVNGTAAWFLNDAFNQAYPEYPSFQRFPSPVSRSALPQYADQAVHYLAGGQTVSKNASLLLQSLDLLDDQTIRPTGSRYATWVLAQFDANNPRAVVNRDQLLETVYTGGGVEDVVYSRAFRLEPELFFVVLAALVANGDITLTIGRTVYDATKLPELAKLPWDERLKFSHIGKPRDIPQLAVEGLFEFFGIPRGRARSEHQQEQALPSVVDKALQYARELAELEGWLGALPPLLESALPDRTMLRKTYRELHEFLDKVPNYSTVGKLRSLPWTKEEIERYQTAWKAQVEPVLALKTRYQLLEPSLSYLKEARSLLSPDDPVAQEITVYLDSVGSGLLDAASLPSLQAAARELQILYIKRYEELHRRYRLSLPEDKARETLRQSSTWQTLSGLRAILPMTFGETFTQLEHQLTDLTVCTAPLSEDLKKSPECQCRFRPTDVHRPPSAVSWFATQAEDLLDRWTEAIFQHAQDPMVEDSIRLLDPAIQPAVRDVIARGEFLQLPPDESVLRALATLFQGLNSVEVDLDALVRDVGEGVPLTLEELKRRVNEALDQLGQGQDLAKTRFLLSRSRALTSNEV